jgi:glutathione S-transferase
VGDETGGPGVIAGARYPADPSGIESAFAGSSGAGAVMTTEARSIRLYSQERNPFSEKVARALAFKKVEFERVLVSEPDDIRALNPTTAQLPVLEIAGERRHDSARILEWVDEIYPEPPLLSSDSKVAEAQRSLAVWSDSSFAFYWNRWRATQEPLIDDEGEAEAASFARAVSNIGRRLGLSSRSGRADLREAQVVEALARRLDDLTGLLGDRSFFHSETPSMADLSVLGMLLLMREGPIPRSREMLEARPALVAYLDRLEAATGGRRVAAA